MLSERKGLERWRRLLGPGGTAGDTSTRAGDAADRAGGRTIRVALVDPHPIAREGVRLLLEPAGDIQVVGMADDARRRYGWWRSNARACCSWSRACRTWRAPSWRDRWWPAIRRWRLLALAATLEAGEARRLLQLAVPGYLSKRASGEQLAAAVRAAAQGLAVLGSWAARIAFQREGPPLSVRQQEGELLARAGRRT